MCKYLTIKRIRGVARHARLSPRYNGWGSKVADRHPKKEIQSTIEYALQRGWRFIKAGPHAHIYGKLYCPKTARDGCRINVYSTPRSPTNHANHIRRRIDRCPHAAI
jgi:hypothetical protein